jgi:DNA-binding response OmpR family regulator
VQTRVKPLRRPRERLSEILLRSGAVDAAALDRALDRQRVQPGRLGTQLLSLGLVTEDALAQALGLLHRVPPYLPSRMPVEPRAVARVPLELARRLRVLPIGWDPERGILDLAAADPDNVAAVDEARFASGARKVNVLAAPEAAIARLIARHYEGVIEEPAFAPELPTLSSKEEQGPPRAPRERGSDPGRQGGKARVLVADPEPRRRRAMAALFEAAGYDVRRAGSAAEARDLLRSGEWSAAWVQEEWAPHVTHPRVRTFGDPAVALEEHATAAGLAAEAQALAEEASRLALGEGFSRARQAAALVRFLAGRRGLGAGALDHLELAAWRAALAGWSLPSRGRPLPGEEVLRAVARYEGALGTGATPAGAADAVRADPSLDPDAVTGLLRWADGAHLLEQAGSFSLLALFPEGAFPEALLSRLAQAGWKIERAAEASARGQWDAVLAAVGPGLSLLEALGAASPEGRPPVFLLSPTDSGPDTMYALRLGAEDVFTSDTHPEVVAAKLERAAGRGRPDRGVVSGNLRDMGFADIVQILANGLKTAVLRLEGPEGTAEVALRDGAIVDARTGPLVGEDALYAIMGWADGAFRIEPDARARAQTIQGNTEGLLMEGFRRLDERHRSGSSTLPEL